MPITDEQQYKKAESLLTKGAKDPGRLKASMASFRGANPHLFQGSVPTTTGEEGQSLATPEGIDPGSPFAKAQGTSEIAELDRQEKLRTDKSAIKSGYSIDLTQDQAPLIEAVRQDPERELREKQFKELTEDRELPNASKLKVFADPPDYEPKSPPRLDPIDPWENIRRRSTPSRDQAMWHEPTVEEFRGALTHGSLRNKLKQEFPGIEDPSKLIDKDLESSRSFQAFQDMAWRHALSQAMKEGRPIHRVAFSAKLSPGEKSLAQGFDTVSGAAGGALQGITLGAFDPLERFSNPEGAERNRQARLRSPNAEMAGEVGGSLVGGPAALAKGAASVLGKKLGTEGLGAAATSIVSGAATGAADATLRQIAQGTADALDAGDTAVEALRRIYETLNPAAIASTAGMGAAGGFAGELIGSGARAGARSIVSSGERGPVLQRNLNTGGRMTATGNVKLEPQLDDLQAAAAANRTTADDVLAERSVDPIASEQLLRQETARRVGTEETEQARARLTKPPPAGAPTGSPGGARQNITVPTLDTAEKIDALAADMPRLTNEGVAKARKLRSIASKLREARELDASGLDKEIAGLDDLAKNKGQKSPDKDLVAVSNFLRELRDNLKFPAEGADEAKTAVDNFAIRDPEGKVKVLGDYSGMKARQYKEQSKAEFENDQLGLPRKLKAEPMELGDAPGEDELIALAEGKTPKVQMTATERGRARDTIRSVGDVDNLARSTSVMEAGERAGVGGNLKLIQKLRDRQDWKKLLGEAFSGISVGPGRIGNKFLSANQMLRAVPTLKSLSGGLPSVGKSTVEASEQLVNLLDKALSEAGGAGARKALGDKILDDMVPELPGGLLRLRGGQAARATGAANRRERDPGPKLTDEEREVAIAVIRNLQNLYGDERKAQ
jgi:hypothetical protein